LGGRLVRRKAQKFDVHTFLSRTGLGRAVALYPANSVIFAQGDTADAVFYLQKGRAKLNVVSKPGKEATVALLGFIDYNGGLEVRSTLMDVVLHD
jgi:CRP/FNR family cyclic AMP-dependent transcriptional regulator